MVEDSKQDKLKRNIESVTRMTVHNGPGIRTLIIFKGCPLHCIWCSTPETQKAESELAVYPGKCIHCNQCLPLCSRNAIKLTDKTLNIDRNLCEACAKCTKICYAEALKMIGTSMSINELVEEIKKDILVFQKSGGGVTVSGGEPLLNTEFNVELYRRLKEQGIRIGVDTCGYVTWDHIEPLLTYIDFFLLDIKHMDPEKHKLFTGVSNELIHQNARLVAEHRIPIYIRIPVIPGYNDSEENLRNTCEFALTLQTGIEIDLLPLHHLGKARYDSLDREYPIEGIPLIPEDVLLRMKKIVVSYGLKCDIVG